MKRHSPQFELPGAEAAFNLAGEYLRQPEPPQTPAGEAGQTLFVDRWIVDHAREIIIHEMALER